MKTVSISTAKRALRVLRSQHDAYKIEKRTSAIVRYEASGQVYLQDPAYNYANITLPP